MKRHCQQNNISVNDFINTLINNYFNKKEQWNKGIYFLIYPFISFLKLIKYNRFNKINNIHMTLDDILLIIQTIIFVIILGIEIYSASKIKNKI